MRRFLIAILAVLLAGCSRIVKISVSGNAYLPHTYSIKVVSEIKDERAKSFVKAFKKNLKWEQYLTVTDSDEYDALVKLKKFKVFKKKSWVIKAQFEIKEVGSSNAYNITMYCEVSPRIDSEERAVNLCGEKASYHWEYVTQLPEDAYSGKINVPPADSADANP